MAIIIPAGFRNLHDNEKTDFLIEEYIMDVSTAKMVSKTINLLLEKITKRLQTGNMTDFGNLIKYSIVDCIEYSFSKWCIEEAFEGVDITKYFATTNNEIIIENFLSTCLRESYTYTKTILRLKLLVVYKKNNKCFPIIENKFGINPKTEIDKF